MAKNTNKAQSPTESKKNETKGKTSSSSKKKTAPKLSSKLGFLKDERFRKIFGIFLIILAVFLTISGISFIFTGAHDLHILAGDILDLEESRRFKNVTGRIGAGSAKLLMHDGFGLAGLIIPFLIFLIGVKIALKKTLLPFAKTFRISLFALFFVPLFIGFFFHHSNPENGQIILSCNDNLVGAFGVFATRWCVFTLGWFGALLLILVISAAVVIINFNPSIPQLAFISNFFAQKKNESAAANDEQDDAPSPREEKKNAFGAAVVSEQKNSMDDILDEMIGEKTQATSNTGNQETKIEEITEVDFETAAAAEEAPPFSLDSTAEIEKEELELTPAVSATTEKDEAESDDLEIENIKEEVELSEDQIDQKVQEFGEYDPTLDLSRYELPNIDLLEAHGTGTLAVDKDELEANKNRIVETLNHYKIEISKIKATIGPTVTLYEIIPAPGVRISKIKNLEDDIALSLAALGIRIIAPIPGKGTIGIEVPNSNADVVAMRSLIASDKFQNAKMELPIAIGKSISNETHVFDLAKMPHLLMAGATGQGKSVGLNAMLVSLLYKKHPSQLKFVLVDPKKVELTLYNRIERHFLAKLPDEEEAIITDTSKVVKTLNSLCIEMDDRYELLKEAQCRNIKEYNQKFIKRKLNPENGHRYLPYIVLVVDEFADLIMTAGKEVETPIARLAQLARAIGIHLIIATQRPSVNIITGTIKANFPARIAFRVTSKIDSRTILDAGGADQLIGRGDMLMSTGNDLIRLQCGFVDTPEVEEITDFIGSQQGYPDAFYLPEVADEGGSEIGNIADEDRDALFEDAARVIVLHQQGSASLLQRKLKLGYNRAGRIIDQLEAAGIIGPFEGSKARKVLIPDEMSLEQLLNNQG
ncbi:MAG: DNA translocase FtsK [Flavobacteriales bacterium]|nr:DNA translocase FtsK [Flavobacteriales bacterium]MDG1765779.1 DNA translocase FtsK [Flavobacteriales bacterium]